MVLIKRFLLIGFCFFPILSSFSQTALPDALLAPPSISAIASYGLSEGLPEACLEKIFTDSRGRLWISSCSHAAIDRRVNFFQYDGRRAYFYPLRPDWAKEENDDPVWLVEGETEGGVLYGVNRERSAVFFWSPDTKEQYFWRFKDGKEIISLKPDPPGGVLAFILEHETYQIYRLTESNNQKIGDIPLQDLGIKDDDLVPPFTIANGKAWFIRQREGLISFDLAQGNRQFHSWRRIRPQLDLRDHIGDYYENGSLQWQIAPYLENALLLYLGRRNGFFSLDLSTLKLTPKANLNQCFFSQQQDWRWLDLWPDKNNNLLITKLGYEDLNKEFIESDFIQALLLDQNDRLHDYTELVKELKAKGKEEGQLDWGERLFSTDFQRQIGRYSYGGFILANLQTELKIKTSPTPSGARAMVPLDSLRLLVNTDGPTYLLNIQNESLDLFTKERLTINTFGSMILSKDQILWAKGGGDSLLQYDFGLERLNTFSIGLDFDKFIFLNPNEIALVSLNGSLFIYHLKERLKRPFLHQDVPFSMASRANDIHLTADSILWIAAENGLWQIHFERKQITHFDQSNGLPGANIMCVLPRKDGRLWLGTVQAGVLNFDPNTLEVKQIDEVNGLAHNTVAGMLADKQNNIWAATFNGLSVLSPQGEVLFNITELNGLIHNEFNRASYVKFPDGRMAFGGVKGVNILDPEQILKARLQKEPLQIFLTQMEYYDKKKKKSQVFQAPFKQEKPIPIPAANRYLSLGFSLSEYVDLPKHTFTYRLISSRETAKSVDVPWTSLGSVSELTLNNLPVGDYTVQILGIDQNSRRVEIPLEIRIQVEEFFYRTWPFYLLCALPLLFGGWIWIRRILTERKRLQVEVDKRTEQIRLDKEVISQQAQELQRLDEAKSRFFTNISHELRTPLTIILGMVEQIEKQPKRWLKDGPKMIRNSGANLLDLVNQILELQKLESGNLRLNMELGDIIPFLRTIFEQFQAFAVSKEQEIEFISEVETLYMDFDSEKIFRIVSNLLSNAVKYTPEKGSLSLSVSSGLKAECSPSHCLILTVEDTGSGIPQEQLPYIFDRFFQAQAKNAQMTSGTGIGLSLTQELVKLLNGKIKVASREGEGTIFQVFLPITQKAPPGQPGDRLKIQSAIFGTNGAIEKETSAPVDLPLALIVEDNPGIAQYLQICLEGNYRTIAAVNGQEGIDLALEHIPDVIVSDVMMPEKNGFELCEILKEDERASHIPIILLTAKSDVESRIAGLKQGADDYLAKPFHEEELLARMQNLLKIRRKLQERYKDLYNNPPTLTQDSPPTKEDAFILQLKEIFDSRMDDPQFDLNALSQNLHLSRSQLGRKVKALTGLSPAVFLRSLRLQKARRLLLNSELSVKEVAYEVGFSDPSYFSKSYSEKYGENPSNTGDF